jgi:hypothetical protein
VDAQGENAEEHALHGGRIDDGLQAAGAEQEEIEKQNDDEKRANEIVH